MEGFPASPVETTEVIPVCTDPQMVSAAWRDHVLGTGWCSLPYCRQDRHPLHLGYKITG